MIVGKDHTVGPVEVELNIDRFFPENDKSAEKWGAMPPQIYVWGACAPSMPPTLKFHTEAKLRFKDWESRM